MNMEQGQQYTFHAPSVSDMINGLRHGTAPQISQGLLSPAPKSGIDTMNEAASAGMNNASQEHFQQKQAQQAEVMNNVQRRLAQGLLESKAQWQQGNMLANEGQDEQTRLVGANLMQQAANSGAAIRKSAESAGIDLTEFGSDVSYEDALQNFTSDTVRGLNKIFNNDMSSDEYYNQTYRTLRDRGYGESVSRKVAAEKAGEYQAQRISQLQDAFQNYGLSDRNSLNSDGVRLVNMMLQEDGNIANSLANMYANPKMDYTTDVGRENMSIQNQMAMEKMLQQAKLNQMANDRKNAQARENMAYKALLNNNLNYNREAYKAAFGNNKSSSKSEPSATQKSKEAKMSAAYFDLMNDGDLDTYKKEMSELTPYMDNDTKEYYLEGIPYVYNAAREFRSDPQVQNSNTRDYLSAIANNPLLIEAFEDVTGSKFPL